MKNIFKTYMQYATNLKRPNGGYITQEERKKAKKRNRKKRK